MSVLEFSQILPQLAVGSKPPGGMAVRRAGFDVLVLTAAEVQPPDAYYPGVAVGRLLLNDDGSAPTALDFSDAEDMAKLVENAVRQGQSVLVTCVEGRNRSTLVATLAFRRLMGASGKDAVAWVKSQRPKNPLTHGPTFTNAWFRQYLLAKPARIPRNPPRPAARPTSARRRGPLRWQDLP